MSEESLQGMMNDMERLDTLLAFVREHYRLEIEWSVDRCGYDHWIMRARAGYAFEAWTYTTAEACAITLAEMEVIMVMVVQALAMRKAISTAHEQLALTLSHRIYEARGAS